MNDELRTRANSACELCGGSDDLTAFAVAPHAEATAEHGVVVCATCRPQLDGDAPLDSPHWRCLQGAIWSEVPAVQVVAWRLLVQLKAEGWANELLDQVWLADEVKAWAEAGLPAAADDDAGAPTLDSNGAPLADGDSVSLIKSLDVKGTSFVAKRGTTVRNIRLTGDPEHIQGKVNGVTIYLKTCFLKKVV